MTSHTERDGGLPSLSLPLLSLKRWRTAWDVVQTRNVWLERDVCTLQLASAATQRVWACMCDAGCKTGPRRQRQRQIPR